jgi:drug/metabolite transporter (DMT)-like permease
MSSLPEPIDRALAIDPRRTAMTGNMLGMASMLFWAAGFPAADILLDTWPPIALIVARLIMALGFMIPVWLLLDGVGPVLNTRWLRGIWVGGIGFGIGTWLLLVSQSLTDPVTVALIASAMPIAATLIEMFNRVRTPSKLFLVGLSASVIGGVVATWGQHPSQLGLGALTAIMSCFLFAWGSFCAVRDFPELSAVGRSTVTFVGALVAVCVLFAGSYLLGFDVTPSAKVDANQIGLLAIYALGAMALSQVCFIAAIGRLGVAVTSLHINTAPFYVMVFLTFLGADWNWQQAFGALIVGLGVIVSQRG